MKKYLLHISVLSVILFNGCTRTHVDVKPLKVNTNSIKTICIQENKKVLDTELLIIIQDEFLKRAINTKIYEEKLPDSCEYKLYYTANSRWDIHMYLKNTSLQIRHNGKIIAAINYEGPSGLNSYKRQSTRTKLIPVFDELLSKYNKLENNKQ